MNEKIIYPIGTIFLALYTVGVALFVAQFFPADFYILGLIVGLIIYATMPAIALSLSKKTYDERTIFQDALIYTGVAHIAFISAFGLLKIVEHFGIVAPWSFLVCFLFFLLDFFFIALALELK